MTHPRILTHYTDALGVERSSPSWAVEHVDALLSSWQDTATEPTRTVDDVVRVRAGGATPEHLRGLRLDREDGTTETLGATLADDLPFGFHHATGRTGTTSLVLHAPDRCPEPPPERGWVVAAQLYAARSTDSWGIGDLRDARRIHDWVDRHGPGGHLMLNPLHACIPGTHPQPSPYFASSRVFLNPIYLCIDDLPGASDDPAVAVARERAVALDAEDLLRHDEVWAAKRAALEALFARQRSDPRGRIALDAAVDAALADPLTARYAAFCADAAGGEPAFHAWLQILLQDQLAQVGGGLIHDLAVGTDRAGADAWLWPECFVLDGTRIGCPPDEFNTQGQDWGLPPPHPTGMRARGYEPFVRAMRSIVSGAAGVRLDHVMGLERLFWIPPDGSPADGVYVTYDLDEMLDVVAIESTRQGAFVVGEDLGTVPDSLRAATAERGLLSYRVMSLDSTHPHDFPRQTMASFTTHDLPTSVGLLSGEDLAAQEDLGLWPNVDGTHEAVARLRAWVGAADDASFAEVVERLHHLLGSSPAALVSVTLDDLALAPLRPNMPGTIDEWPNWRIALPAALDAVLGSDLAEQILGAVVDARSSA